MKRLFLNQPKHIFNFPSYLKYKPYTMVPFPSLAQVVDLVGDLDKKGIVGKVVECGCWRGGLVAFVASHTDREVVGIDKFDGLNDAGEHDQKVVDKHKQVKGHLAVEGDRAPLPSNAKYITGDAADSLPAEIALLRVDVDLYDDTKRVLNKAKDKLVPGAWVVLDDYVHFEGVRRATHEFLVENNRWPKIRQHPYGGSYYFHWL